METSNANNPNKSYKNKLVPEGTILYNGITLSTKNCPPKYAYKPEDKGKFKYTILYTADSKNTAYGYASLCLNKNEGWIRKYRVKKDVELPDISKDFVHYDANEVEKDFCDSYGYYLDWGGENGKEIVFCNPEKYLELIEISKCEGGGEFSKSNCFSNTGNQSGKNKKTENKKNNKKIVENNNNNNQFSENKKTIYKKYNKKSFKNNNQSGKNKKKIKKKVGEKKKKGTLSFKKIRSKSRKKRNTRAIEITAKANSKKKKYIISRKMRSRLHRRSKPRPIKITDKKKSTSPSKKIAAKSYRRPSSKTVTKKKNNSIDNNDNNDNNSSFSVVSRTNSNDNSSDSVMSSD